MCFIVTRKPLGQSPSHENSALLECCSTLQKCQIGPMAPNTLSCSGAVQTPLLGFFCQSLYLDMFSSFVYDFFFFFNSSFLKSNYLVDKSLKINLDKVQIIYNFIVIQSSQIGRASCRERV